jgi:hypothetical protein
MEGFTEKIGRGKRVAVITPTYQEKFDADEIVFTSTSLLFLKEKGQTIACFYWNDGCFLIVTEID